MSKYHISFILSVLLSVAAFDGYSQNKYGVIDTDGQYVVHCEYDYIWPYSDGVAIAERDGHFGYIDTEGNVVVPFEYDFLSEFQDGLAIAEKDGMWGFVDRAGNVAVPLIFEAVFPFHDGRSNVRHDGRWIPIDNRGARQARGAFDEMQPFSFGYSSVKLGGMKGFVGTDGNLLNGFIYKDTADQFSEGFVAVRKEDLWGFIDVKGKNITRFIYEEALPFSEGKAAVKISGQWGFINSKGKIVIPASLDAVDPDGFKNGRAVVSKNGRLYLIDTEGHMINHGNYDDIEPWGDGLFRIEQGGRYGLMDMNGRELHPCNLDEIGSVSDGMIRFKRDEYWGFLSLDGHEVIPEKYDEAFDMSSGLAAVRVEDKYGYINKDDVMVLPLSFDGADAFHEGYAIVEMNPGQALWEQVQRQNTKDAYSDYLQSGLALPGYVNEARRILLSKTHRFNDPDSVPVESIAISMDADYHDEEFNNNSEVAIVDSPRLVTVPAKEQIQKQTRAQKQNTDTSRSKNHRKQSFFLFGVGGADICTDKPEYSYGGMIAFVDRTGLYVKYRSNFVDEKPFQEVVSTDRPWIRGDLIPIVNSLTAGMVIMPEHFGVYFGVGYGEVKYDIELYSGNNALVKDFSIAGIAGDLGIMLNFGPVSLFGGVSVNSGIVPYISNNSIAFKKNEWNMVHAMPEVGIGLSF